MWQDVRLATRSFRKSPTFTAVAVVTLALAIGANTAIVSLLNALLLRDLPVRDPQTLVQVGTLNADGFESGLTYAMFEDLTRRQQVFSAVLSWNTGVYNVTIDNTISHVAVSAVSGNFFDELGAQPVIGRLIARADLGERAATPEMVAVVSHAFWRGRLGGDAGVIGRQILIEATPFTIIGVAPADFSGLALVVAPDVAVPLTAFPRYAASATSTDPRAMTSTWVRVTGRLKSDVTIAQARASIDSFWPALKSDNVPASFVGARRDRFLATALTVHTASKGLESGPGLRGRFTRPLYITLAIAVLVLAIACVNLASLMVARGISKSHEVTVRLALGAARFRVMRPILVEGVMLAVAGAGAGVLFAMWTTDALAQVILRDFTVRATLDVAPDTRVLLFTAALASVVGVLFSIAPAWRAGREDAASSLRLSGRTVTGMGRSGRMLVAVQVGLSLVLLTHAGLLIRSLQQVRAVSSGMQPDNVFVLYPYAPPGGYRNINNDTYYPNVVARLESVRGVERAAAANFKPAGGGVVAEKVSRVPGADAEGITTTFMSVSPNFFDTLGMRLRAGRDFTWNDHSRSRRVAVVSETFASRLFPNAPAIGQRIRIGVLPSRQDVEIVGVVADAHIYDLKDPNLASVYVASLQEPDLVDGKCFVLRGVGFSFDDVKAAISGFGYDIVPASEAQSLEYIVDRVLLQDRLIATFAAFFGAVALLLAAIGVYGLMSFEIAQRRRELGIRVALGAEPGRILSGVLSDGLTVTGIGLVFGAVVAVATVQLVRSLIFGISAHDPVTFTVAPIALLSIAAMACLGPAVHASRTDPMVTLRVE